MWAVPIRVGYSDAVKLGKQNISDKQVKFCRMDWGCKLAPSAKCGEVLSETPQSSRQNFLLSQGAEGMKIVSDERIEYAVSQGGNSIYPNTFQAHNFYVDELMHLLTPEEFKVLMFAVREIMGWQDKRDSCRSRIAISVFSGGNGTDRKVFSYGTGLSPNTVKNCIDSLCSFGILVKYGVNSDGTEYELVYDKGRIDILSLKRRQEIEKERAKSRTQKARDAVVSKKSVLSDSTESVLSDSTPGGMSDSTNETNETQETNISAQQEKEAAELLAAINAHKIEPRQSRTGEEAKKGVETILANLETTMNPAVSNPRLEKKAYRDEVAPIVASVFGRSQCKDDESAANQMKEMGVPIDFVKAYCRFLMGEKFWRSGDERAHPFALARNVERAYKSGWIAPKEKNMGDDGFYG
jgi:hypothetical protein